jgi:hypothetical protein
MSERAFFERRRQASASVQCAVSRAVALGDAVQLLEGQRPPQPSFRGVAFPESIRESGFVNDQDELERRGAFGGRAAQPVRRALAHEEHVTVGNRHLDFIDQCESAAANHVEELIGGVMDMNAGRRAELFNSPS